MSRPGSSPDEKGVSQNGDPGGHRPVFTNTLNAAVSPETRLLSAFARDTQARKVDLAGRGESYHVVALFYFLTEKHEREREGGLVNIFLHNYLK